VCDTSTPQALKWQINIASRGLGPAVAAILFAVVGDHWREWEMRIVILCGVGLSLVPAALLFTFSDKHALGASSDAHERIADPSAKEIVCVSKSLQGAEPLLNDDSEGRVQQKLQSSDGRRGGGGGKDNASKTTTSGDDEHTPLLLAPNSDVSINVTTDAGVNGLRHGNQHNKTDQSDAMKRRLIPVLIAIADIVSGLASGMTVRMTLTTSPLPVHSSVATRVPHCCVIPQVVRLLCTAAT